MTQQKTDIGLDPLIEQLMAAIEQTPEVATLLASKLKLVTNPEVATSVILQHHSTFRDVLTDYTVAIQAIQMCDYHLTDALNFDYAFEVIISQFETHHGLHMLLTETKPKSFKDSKWVLDETWSEADHVTCYNSSELQLKDWLRGHAIGGIANNLITKDHYLKMDIPTQIEMVKNTQSTETKIAVAINDVIQTDVVNSFSTLRTRILAAKSQ